MDYEILRPYPHIDWCSRLELEWIIAILFLDVLFETYIAASGRWLLFPVMLMDSQDSLYSLTLP